MKINIHIIAFSLLLCSCHESLEQRAGREAREYTRKNCPAQVAKNVTLDSMTCVEGSRTIHYYYTLSGPSDTTAINKAEARKMVLDGIREATSIRAYKDEGFSFAYTYHSAKNKGQELFSVTLTEKDYKN